MRVELRTEAISDLVEAAWFYERQRSGLGEQFSDAMFAHLAYLETVAGGHEVVFGLHRMLAKYEKAPSARHLKSWPHRCEERVCTIMLLVHQIHTTEPRHGQSFIYVLLHGVQPLACDRRSGKCRAEQV